MLQPTSPTSIPDRSSEDTRMNAQLLTYGPHRIWLLTRVVCRACGAVTQWAVNDDGDVIPCCLWHHSVHVTYNGN